MIDFEVPADTRLLVDTVRRFVETEVQPHEATVEASGRVPEDLRAVREKARALGLYGMSMPEEVGGGGLDTVTSCLVEEQMGKTSTTLIRYVFGQLYPMLLACKAEQRDRYLLPTVRGDRVCSMAITEPGAGSDATSITTSAVRDGDGYVLNGTKHFISDGARADYVVVMAVTDSAKRARGGITLFLVDKGTPGFRVARVQPMMGHHGSDHAELVFENCRVGADKVLGEVGGGFDLGMKSISRVRLVNVGARSVGMATRLIEMARQHAKTRVQFGKPIGEFQMIQQMLADMATQAYAARMMVLNTAWEIDQGLDPRQKVSMVKLYCSEMIGRVADSALQIFGGMGYTTDLPVERIVRDSRVTRIWDGTSEIHRVRIAKAILRNGLQA
jgi:acyl-CoA dehydrogenase